LKNLLIVINGFGSILTHQGRRDGMIPFGDSTDCTHSSSSSFIRVRLAAQVTEGNGAGNRNNNRCAGTSLIPLCYSHVKREKSAEIREALS
jgi:hypothetical protein